MVTWINYAFNSTSINMQQAQGLDLGLVNLISHNVYDRQVISHRRWGTADYLYLTRWIYGSHRSTIGTS